MPLAGAEVLKNIRFGANLNINGSEQLLFTPVGKTTEVALQSSWPHPSFTGNILLKFAESLYDINEKKQIRNEYFERFNFENYGGTPILGVSKPVVIGHGISRGKAFKNMILVAEKMLETGVLDKMREELQ